MTKSVSIILLNYNTTNDTISCIESLLKVKYKNFNIIVVDNKSKSEELDKLKTYINGVDKCELIISDENGGFAKGNNIGIRYAKSIKSEYILLLNCDTEVEPEFLDYLVQSIEEDKENTALAIGKIKYYSDKNKIWYGGGMIDWNNYTGVHFGEGDLDNEIYNDKKEITFATGCAILINANLNVDIELPEDYFMYYEDVDFSARMLDAGYKIIYNPKSIIYHKVGIAGGGEGSPFTVKWSNRGRLIFMNKYRNKCSFIRFNIIKTKFYLTRVIKMLLFLLKGESEKSKSLYEGIVEGRKFVKEHNITT